VKTPDLKALLRARYAAPEHAIFFEVANSVGATQRSYADAVAMSLFPSRGLTLHGFELKVSRNDWLRELKKPEKAEGVFGFMDYWWIVAPEGVVKENELPATWGLLTEKAGTLAIDTKAPKLEPVPVPRSFLAALLRRANEMAMEPVTEALAESRREGYETGRKSGLDQGSHAHKALLEAVLAFEEASGLKLDRYSEWGNQKLAAAVKQALAGADSESLLRTARNARNMAEEFVRRFDAATAKEAVPL